MAPDLPQENPSASFFRACLRSVQAGPRRFCGLQGDNRGLFGFVDHVTEPVPCVVRICM